jgi:Mg2+ and Co2+ transporter CorA
MFEDGHLLIILHPLPGTEAQAKALLFWRAADGNFRTNLPGSAMGALGDLLSAYESRLADLDVAEQAAQTATQYHAVLESLAPMVRLSRGLHHGLQQARDMVKTERDLINARDRAASIERSAEVLFQDAQFGLSFTAAKQAEEQAQSAQRMAATAHRLNVLAGFFLPLTALSGVFGMEIHSGIRDSPAAFWAICASSLACGVVLSLSLRKT